MYDAFYNCRKGVRWKASIQSYEATVPLATLNTFAILKNRKFKPLGFDEFDIFERGKKRHIRAVKIQERCVQRTLCDNYLNPLLQSKLIYDNGASVKGKGIDFSLNRLKEHLHRYYRKYHTNEGYIFQYDFSSYFDNIDHDILIKMLEDIIPDKEIFPVVKSMIDCFGNKGLGLGSQVSQICAIFYPTLIDKYFKETLRCKWYGRYMDDGYCLCHTKEQAIECKKTIFDLCEKLNIKINERKVKISKLSHTFVFLKKRIFLTETGKVIMKYGRKSLTQTRRKLKRLAYKVIDPRDKLTLTDFVQAFQSSYGTLCKYKNFHSVQNLWRLYIKLLRMIRMEQERCLTSEHTAELPQI